MKKLTILILLYFIFVHTDASMAAEKGKLYHTDIKTYIYHAPITSYNVGGKTVIDAEILNWHYGFDVYWLPDERRLEICDKGNNFNSLEALNGGIVESAKGEIGTPFAIYYETDIVTTLNGIEIESYNIDGRTFIVAEEMRNCGYIVEWSDESRTLRVTKPLDFYKIETDFGVIETNIRPDAVTDKVSPGESASFSRYKRGVLVSEEDGTLQEIKTPSESVLCGAFTGSNYMKLSDFLAVTDGEAELIKEIESTRTEWVNGITYTDDYNLYTLNLSLKNTDCDTAKPTENPERTVYTPETACYYGYMKLNINGEEAKFLSRFPTRNQSGNGEREMSLLIADGEIYLPSYMLAKYLGYENAF